MPSMAFQLSSCPDKLQCQWKPESVECKIDAMGQDWMGWDGIGWDGMGRDGTDGTGRMGWDGIGRDGYDGTR